MLALINNVKEQRDMAYFRKFLALGVLSAMTSCPAMPDMMLNNISGRSLIVHQGKHQTIIPDKSKIMINLKKTISVTDGNFVTSPFNFLKTHFGEIGSPQCRSYCKELSAAPFPHKLMAVVLPDMKIYIQQRNLPKPFKNQPVGFPIQMRPKESP